MRDAVVDYRDRVGGEEEKIRSLVDALLADVPTRDNVMVFRSEEHRVGVAAGRAADGGRRPGRSRGLDLAVRTRRLPAHRGRPSRGGADLSVALLTLAPRRRPSYGRAVFDLGEAPVRALAAVLSIVFLLTGSAVAAAQPAWTPTPIAWGPCPDTPDSECGTLAVPLDWTRPWGPTTTLAVARHRATDPAHRQGVLLVNPGGPGTSNAEFALFTGYFSPQVEADFDIVGFDERGTQGSGIIRCDFPAQAPSDDPTTAAQFAALRAYNQQLISQCRKDNSPIFDYANTAVGAQDMDAVRQALGEQKVSYDGISYGTLLGQQYAEMYGNHVRAMVLDSNMDHSVDLTRLIGDRATAADDVFTQFVEWCDANETCVLHGQDVLAVWRQALQAAGDASFREVVFNTLYGPDFATVAQMIADMAAGGRPVSPRFEYNYPSIRLATVCQDFSLRIKDFAQYSQLRAVELRHAPLMQGSPLGHSEATACIGIPGPPANPPHPLDLSRAPTILLMNSRHDPATPYAWALDIHRQAPRNTALLTYEGTGHGVYTRSACTRAAADTYLLTLNTPTTPSCPEV